MANEEQLAILRQGIEVWNKWRTEQDTDRGIVDFSGADLEGAFLENIDLYAADLTGANLSRASLSRADLRSADLSNANLKMAELSDADISGATLNDASLFNALLSAANLSETYLTRTDLTISSLHGANFNGAHLNKTIFSESALGNNTILGNLDLREAIGIGNVIHDGPSSISTDTFILSKGDIPVVFLQGCGLSNWEIEEVKLYNPDLSNDEINKVLYKIYDLRATQALQISPLFISYSHGDRKFVDKIEKHLNSKGIRFWRDIHNMKSGRMEKQIDRAIRQNQTVLLVLSKQSLSSDWVEHEVRTARQLEKDMRRDVLCPVALDDSWKDSKWEKRIMEQVMKYNILDFSAWQDDVKFEGMFRKLIDGLELFYKG